MSMKGKSSNICWWQECIKVELGAAEELEGTEHQLTRSIMAAGFTHRRILLAHITLKHYIRQSNITVQLSSRIKYGKQYLEPKRH